ncbi:hypothetical protein QFC21_003433 [Naganishia friedmannii]|uniref:Uncharacterized protein n=1 Tax=Naganishia friedmannii TaxID=89922 RepID=A0ACC2VP69_9TREE|nr:hypothetical protein QFC21_003433 [Naganishia friedmannii]
MQTLASPTRTPRTSTTPCTPLRPSPTPQQPRYSHPYGIQSTSSGVLSSSRGTSSPNTVISTHSYQQHKSSQSIKSLLRNSSSVDDLASSSSSSDNVGNSSYSKRGDKENIVLAEAGKYDSVRTRKRTLAQRASMSDLASSSTSTTTGHHTGPGEWELDIMASPRKNVKEMREVLMHGGGVGKVGSGREVGAAGVGGRAEGEVWTNDLQKLPRRSEDGYSLTAENRQAVDFQLLPRLDGRLEESPSHVRRVVDRFGGGGHVFDDLRSPSVHRQHNHHDDEGTDDPFLSQQSAFGRYKPRTTSTASLYSAISVLSSDTDMDDEAGRTSNVIQRALQFEKGVIGRLVPKTAEEREGRVLNEAQLGDGGDECRSRDCRLGSKAVELEARDVFGDAGMTIKPRKSPLTPSLSTSHLALTPAQEVDAKDVQSASSSLAGPNALQEQTFVGSDIRSTAEREADIGHENNLGHSKFSGDTSSKLVDPFIAPTVTSIESDQSILQELASRDDISEEAPPHMSRMAQHEKAGLRPYGALRRAYTSPVSSGASPVGNRPRGGGEFPRLPTMGMGAPGMLDGPLAGDKGRRDAHRLIVATQGSMSKKEPGDTLNLFNFQPPTDSDRPQAEPLRADPTLLQDTTRRLAIVEDRIQDLERAMAEVAERQKTMHLGTTRTASSHRSATLGSKGNEASDEGGESANPGDRIKMTIAEWFAWFSGVNTTPSPSASSAATPIPFAVPANLRQIPGYVFLVGVGLSVIVVRTVFLSPYSQKGR